MSRYPRFPGVRGRRYKPTAPPELWEINVDGATIITNVSQILAIRPVTGFPAGYIPPTPPNNAFATFESGIFEFGVFDIGQISVGLPGLVFEPGVYEASVFAPGGL